MRPDNACYVYRHSTKNGKPFYIGKGTSPKSAKPTSPDLSKFSRAYNFNQRSDYWKRIYNKEGCIMIVLEIHLIVWVIIITI